MAAKKRKRKRKVKSIQARLGKTYKLTSWSPLEHRDDHVGHYYTGTSKRGRTKTVFVPLGEGRFQR
jgi:hypothetical protein